MVQPGTKIFHNKADDLFSELLMWYYKYNTSNYMKEYQQKYIVRTILYSRVTMIILFILLILFIRTIMELNDKRIDASNLREESILERKDLEEKVVKATEKEETIKTERGFETYVRTTYPVVGDGEGVIVIYDAPTSLVTPVREDMTVWERLLVLWHRFVPK